MKSIKNLLYIIISLFTIFSCRDSFSDKYNGDAKLHFSKEVSSKQTVIVGGGDVTIPVVVGSIIPVPADQQFELVVDTDKSTAKEGVDFIVSPGIISAGKTTGSANVKLIESAATTVGKTVVFKLKSTSLSNAIFDDTYTLTIKKGCKYDQNSFVGNYKVLEDIWQDYNIGDKVPLKAGSKPGDILIMQTNNTSLDNRSTAYIIVSIKEDGSAVVTANEPFKYGTSSFIISGAGTVDMCNGSMDLMINYGTSYKNQRFRIGK